MSVRQSVRLLFSCACLVLAFSANCTHLPACPAEGGPAWSEWRSPHFRLLTDVANQGEAERLATQLEQFRAAIVAAAWRDVPEPPDLIEVITLRSAFETRAVQPRFVDGHFFSKGPVSFILTSATERFQRAHVLKHETVHALMHQLDLDINAPSWFCEGMAEYLAATDIDETTDKITFGALAREPLNAVYRLGVASWDELWLKKTEGRGLIRQRGTGWLLVHYLFNRERQRFARYQSSLAQAKDPEALWLEVFPELNATTLTKRLSEYWEAGEYAKYQAIIPRPHFYFAERILPDAEVHALLGTLLLTARDSETDNETRGRGEISEALRLDPLNLRARIVESFLIGKNLDDTSIAQQLAQKHPNDWRAWLLLANAADRDHRPSDFEAALRQARALGYRERRATPPRAAEPY